MTLKCAVASIIRNSGWAAHHLKVSEAGASVSKKGKLSSQKSLNLGRWWTHVWRLTPKILLNHDNF